MYRYFISFVYPNGSGRIEYIAANPLTSYGQIEVIEGLILEKTNYEKVCITNYILLSKEESQIKQEVK